MNTIWIVIPILLVLMFLLGTELNKEAFVNVARHPKAVIMERIRCGKRQNKNKTTCRFEHC
ncbi:MAG: hypothetical protein E7087_07360 [Bacteroidales bacterium]|nr:hypothetical protein [Bacteroidales bacterium]